MIDAIDCVLSINLLEILFPTIPVYSWQFLTTKQFFLIAVQLLFPKNIHAANQWYLSL